MVDTVLYYTIFIALIGIERLIELRISKRNAKWAFSQGGVEAGQGHFPYMKLLHTGFLIAAPLEAWLLERTFIPALGVAMLALAIIAQALRYWAITSLGPYWNVRVIVVPGAKVQVRGPYRFLRHPNYVAVILEGIVLPLIHSAYLTSIIFTVLNAYLLRVRIACEERALQEHCNYEEALGDRTRFLPSASSP